MQPETHINLSIEQFNLLIGEIRMLSEKIDSLEKKVTAHPNYCSSPTKSDING